MKIKYFLLQSIIKFIAFFISLFGKRIDNEIFKDEFLVFYSYLPQRDLLNDLVNVFTKIFSEYPWNENWNYNDVINKIKKEIELTKDSFLVIMKGDQNLPVAGFSWGALLEIELLPERIAHSLKIDINEFKDLIVFFKKRKINKIVYFDEFAIDRAFRGGINNIRFLLMPGLELGSKNSVYQTMFWSTPKSKIVPLATYMGYEIVYKKIVNDKEIVFLFHPNFYSLLEIAQRLKDEHIKFFMRIVSIIFHNKRDKD